LSDLTAGQYNGSTTKHERTAHKDIELDTRYIDAERKLATALGWTGVNYTGIAGVCDGRVQGVVPDGTGLDYAPAWARSGDDCVRLMVSHRCFVAAEMTSQGVEAMVAHWTGTHGLSECIAVPTSAHANDDAAFRYAAVLGVTSKVEAENLARELTSLVSA
jgi:hypothetical protein